jgi:hypothetical protein
MNLTDGTIELLQYGILSLAIVFICMLLVHLLSDFVEKIFGGE